MLVNRGSHAAHKPERRISTGGLGIYDVCRSGPAARDRLLALGGTGVHRFTFDGRYAYISPEIDGYLGNIVMILDLEDPAQAARRSGAGGCRGSGRPAARRRRGRAARTAAIIRSGRGNRLYVSYWHGGFVILDIDDMAKPKLVSGLDWSPPFITPTHTALPVPFPLSGRARACWWPTRTCAKLEPGAAGLPVAGRHHRRDAAGAVRQLPGGGVDGTPQPEFTGCHQPIETITGTEVPVAWFAHGLRIVDIADPHAPREVATSCPTSPAGRRSRVQQRRLRRRPRPDLPDRPDARPAHRRAYVERGGRRPVTSEYPPA